MFAHLPGEILLVISYVDTVCKRLVLNFLVYDSILASAALHNRYEVMDSCSVSYIRPSQCFLSTQSKIRLDLAYAHGNFTYLCCSHTTKTTQWIHPRTGKKKYVSEGTPPAHN